MTLDQIKLFLRESIAKGVQWERIRLLGGEPTLHPNFFEILDHLIAYRDEFSKDTVIEIITNGAGKKVASVLEKIPKGIVVDNTRKISGINPTFNTFNVAPADLPAYRRADFRNACIISNRCGIGLSPSGYYPCAAAGGIDRIVGWNLGRPSLPDDGDAMLDLLSKFCRHCGHFKRNLEPPVRSSIMSPTWRAAYERYRRLKPKLTRYGSAPAGAR